MSSCAPKCLSRTPPCSHMKVNTPSFINPAPQGVTEAAARLEVKSFLHDAAQNLTNQPPGPVVLLSHVPLADLAAPGAGKLIVDAVQPSYLFSGHTHHPTVHCHHSNEGGCTLQEITVPTSSYRMGEAHAGLGAAVISMWLHNGHISPSLLATFPPHSRHISPSLPPHFPLTPCHISPSLPLSFLTIGENGHLSYEVLWFPPRFPVLFCYLLWTIVAAVTMVTCVCCRCVVLCSRTNTN